LLERVFERWKGKPKWISDDQVGHLFRNRDNLSRQERAQLASLPPALRKAKAIRRMLEVITSSEVAAIAGSADVDPDELIVGNLLPFSVGQGKEFVGYLSEEEELRGMLDYLGERSPMGHIVPDHDRVVKRGLRALIDECEQRITGGGNADFYTSVMESLEGVISYAAAYAEHVEARLARLPSTDSRRSTLTTIAARLRRVPAEPAQSFHDAVQAIFLVHCALHWTVEIVPLGRLDQILLPFFKNDLAAGQLTREQAQEILDSFWIKLDETAILNYRHAENRFTATDGVLTGFWGSSNYDQGGLVNQWMQQITIGGVLPTNDRFAKDACNEVTELCLECARRLPLNSPTLDLRVHKGTPSKILKLAAKALLSGGAHPVLLNDDRIVPGLSEHVGAKVPLATARNYACDGCYETMYAGETEFSFGFISAPGAIERTLNRGAGLAATGPINLLGFKDSWRTPPASQIRDWDDFWSLLRKHILLGCHRYLNDLLKYYGNKATIAPSPLLSALIGGCLEKGRDLSDGGANYHLFSPLLTGISTATDSLFVIKTLVFEQSKFRLEELVTCLGTDWANAFIGSDKRAHPAFGMYVSRERIEEIRAMCMEQPKFGFGIRAVDTLAWKLIETFCECVFEARDAIVHREGFARLKQTYGKDFQLLFAPGVGTFEQYVFSGSFLGASPDGRRARTPIASDLSPSPVLSDLDPLAVSGNDKHLRTGKLIDGLQSYAHASMNRLGDGAAVDFNLPEDFQEQHLAKMLKEFAHGHGGSIATFTVADPATFKNAQERPDEYNLVRVRMGGWTEFFIALFPDHQEQHRRRPLFVE